jgi:hypothetical protein
MHEEGVLPKRRIIAALTDLSLLVEERSEDGAVRSGRLHVATINLEPFSKGSARGGVPLDP